MYVERERGKEIRVVMDVSFWSKC